VVIGAVNVSGKVSLSRTVDTESGSLDAGGIAGYVSNTIMDGVSFTRKIDIPNTLISVNDKFVGGLVGQYSTKGELKNSSALGDITVTIGAGTGIAGGPCGTHSGFFGYGPGACLQLLLRGGKYYDNG
jgi:hypothetical protein